MKIAVCLKDVPDTNEPTLKIREDNLGISEEKIGFTPEPFGEIAAEAAIRLREKMGGAIYFIAIGPERTKEVLIHTLAMGLTAKEEAEEEFDESKIDDKSILVLVDNSSLILDPLVRAKILAKVIADIGGCDIILCGKKAADDGFGQVGAAIAKFLSIPLLSAVTGMELIRENRLKARLRIEGGERVLECQVPAVLTCDKGLVDEARIPGATGIMAVDEQKIKMMDFSSFAKDLETLKSSPDYKILGFSLPPVRKAGVIIEGKTLEEKADNLIKILREEIKVI